MTNDSNTVLKNCASTIFVAILVLVVFGIGFAGCSALSDITYGEGYRDGHVQRLSKRGYIFKTWEGEMAMSGFKAGKSSTSNTWDFSVSDASVLTELQKLDDGVHVRLHYRQVWSKVPWRGETDFFVTRIEKLAD